MKKKQIDHERPEMMRQKPDKELLVAILPHKSDLSILQDQGWYRIPVDRAPRRWPPRWLAFYQPKIFDDDAFLIRWYGQVSKIETVARRELFPNEFESEKSSKRYYRLSIDDLLERKQPIPSLRPRRLVFIPTTLEKFTLADQINDLFDDSPLENWLWRELKKRVIPAERQWSVNVQERWYQLDFAFFCHDGKIDVETDGDTWHIQPDRIAADNRRNNDVESQGWHVLRFNSQEIQENQGEYCLRRIQESINRLDGLTDDGLVSRVFYPSPSGDVQQLNLFEEPGEYDRD